MWIEIQTHTGPAVISVVYRHPNNRHDNITQFSTKFMIYFTNSTRKSTLFMLLETIQHRLNQSNFRQHCQDARKQHDKCTL